MATNENEETKPLLAVLIDADNISAASVADIFKIARTIGEPVVRRAYGLVSCFSSQGGWARAKRDYGIVEHPQVANISGKNATDIALVIDAMELLYKSACGGIFIVSSDSDFTGLAAKIRECGKAVYGMGDAKTPKSFKSACTKFFDLHPPKKAAAPISDSNFVPGLTCPRCSGKLEQSWTKTRHSCRTCPSCGGMTMKLASLKSVFADESLKEILESAKHQTPPAGCVCPDCGSPMSLLRVAVGEKRLEIDVCAKCRAVWYDKSEFEAIAPNDGVVVPTISAGKAFRREIVASVSADLRSGRLKVLNTKGLKTVLKVSYHVPDPDIESVLGALKSQRVIMENSKTGKISILSELPL